MRNRLTILIIGIIYIAVFAYFLVWPTIQSTSTRIGMAKTIGVIIELIIIGALFLYNRRFKKLIGEDGTQHRSRIHVFIIWFSLIIFVAICLLSLNEINSFLPSNGNQSVSLAQLSIIVISLVLAGIPLAAASIAEIKTTKKQELIRISRKYVLVLLLFLVSVACLYLSGLKPIDSNEWAQTILFWISAPTFYGSIILFIIGLVDLPFVFLDLDVFSEVKPTGSPTAKTEFDSANPITTSSLSDNQSQDKGNTKNVLLMILIIGLIVTIGIGIATWKITDHVTNSFIPSLTSALVWVTAYYAIATAKLMDATNRGVQIASQQAQIMVNALYVEMVPVVALEVQQGGISNAPVIDISWYNIGRGPALNFRCWIEDPQYRQLRTRGKSLCDPFIEVSAVPRASKRIQVDGFTSP